MHMDKDKVSRNKNIRVCSTCGLEYESWVTWCTQCGKSLRKIQEQEEAEVQINRPIKLMEVEDEYQANWLLMVLKEHDIPAYQSSLLSGDITNTYAGSALDKVELYVGEADLEQAQGLVAETEFSQENTKDKNDEEQKCKEDGLESEGLAMEKEPIEGQFGRPVKLTEVADGMEADYLVMALREKGIPSYKTSLRSGGVMNVYMGFSIYGAAVFVDEYDLVSAKQVLEEIKLLEADKEDSDLEAELEADTEYGLQTSINTSEKFQSVGASILRKIILIGLCVMGAVLLLGFIGAVYLILHL